MQPWPRALPRSRRRRDHTFRTAALAVSFVQESRLHVLGIDILDRVPGLARHVIAASDAADRVTVRKRTSPTSPTTPGSTWHGSVRRSSRNLPWPARCHE